MLNQNCGITFIRKCKQNQVQTLTKKYEEVKHFLQQNKSTQVYWINLFMNGQYCWQTKEQVQTFQNWAQNLLLQVENGVPQYISSIGFINNPVGNTRHQTYHMDYHPQYKNLFINMHALVYQNSTQFIGHHLKCQPKQNLRGNLQNYGNSDLQLLQQEGVDFMTVSQVICKPFGLLRMQPGTVHRGIINRGETDRIIFYIGYSSRKLVLEKEQAVGDF